MRAARNRARAVLLAGAVVLGLSSCRGCDERWQEHLRKMAHREGNCYAMPVREVAEVVRQLLIEDGFPVPAGAPDDTGLIATGWKDTTIGASRLTSAGRPARARREVFIAGGPCLRVASREIEQSTPKEGPDYADTSYQHSFAEDDLILRLDERLQAHARPWQPPP
jgi:hypothetical protein